MSTETKKIIKQLLKTYEEVDGATRLGAYRDTLTDLCHIALTDRTIKGRLWDDKLSYIKNLLLDAFNTFEEEAEDNEIEKIRKIPRKDLPLLLGKKYQFESANKLFEERLKSIT